MALISPVGGSLMHLELAGKKVISAENLENPDGIFFGKTMAPWPNRLKDGRYEHQGKSYQFENLDALGNLNHGLIGRRELELRSHEESAVVLGYRFGADPGYPFEVDFEIAIEISEFDLAVTMTAQNLGAGAAPFACGQHPYFLAPGDFEVQGDFSHMVHTDERMLPSSISEIEGFSYQTGHLDGCFFGARVALLKTSEFELEVELGENMDYFMLYRPPLEVGDSLLAIEPMSAMANVFQEDIESVLLAPEETKHYSYRIRMR